MFETSHAGSLGSAVETDTEDGKREGEGRERLGSFDVGRKTPI